MAVERLERSHNYVVGLIELDPGLSASATRWTFGT